MFLAGIQEEKDRGVWISILEMDRKQVVKKYRGKRSFFYPCTKITEISVLLSDIYNDKNLNVRKKQFSQIGRPPKYKQVPPRILFRPENGHLYAEHLQIFSDFRTPRPILLLEEKTECEKLSCELVELLFLKTLFQNVLQEKRLSWDEEGIFPQEGAAFLATAIALWGGEKIWRMVRYGG